MLCAGYYIQAKLELKLPRHLELPRNQTHYPPIIRGETHISTIAMPQYTMLTMICGKEVCIKLT